MKPYYEDQWSKIYLGDCREILPTLPKVDLVLTDPPYGMNWDDKISVGKNGTGGRGKSRNWGRTIVGDNEEFDPSFLMQFDKVIIFGFNHFPNYLAKGSALVWLKRYDDGFGSYLSDAEIAWMKGGCGVYCFRDLSNQGESKYRSHPTQKPIPLMRWCIEKAGKAEAILDPFMGSGTTLVAAKNLNRKSIGIEIEEKYCEISARRLQQEVFDFSAK